MTTTNQLNLFREVLAVNCENHTKDVSTPGWKNEDIFIVKEGGTYGYNR
jgi:hypothetical protein